MTGMDDSNLLVAPSRTWIFTSPFAALGRPNRPATKKVSGVPSSGSFNVTSAAFVEADEGPNTRSPERFVDRADTLTVTGPVAPVASISLTDAERGAQVR